MKKLIIASIFMLTGCNFDVGVNPELRAQGAECRSITEAFVQTSPDFGYRDNLVYVCIDGFMYLRTDTSVVLGECNPQLVTATSCYPSDIPILP